MIKYSGRAAVGISTGSRARATKHPRNTRAEEVRRQNCWQILKAKTLNVRLLDGFNRVTPCSGVLLIYFESEKVAPRREERRRGFCWAVAGGCGL